MSERSKRSYGLWLALVAIVGLGLVLVGGRRDDGDPLDPDGTGPAGAKGLVLLLESLGAEVEVVALPDAGHEVALTLRNHLDEDGQRFLDEWVDEGGVLVNADVSLPVVGRGSPNPGLCDIDALGSLIELDADDLLALAVGAGDTSCFGDRTGATVVARARGAGIEVQVGTQEVFLNGRLDDADNAALAAALLAPVPGRRVAFVHGTLAGSGTRSLSDLIHPGIKWGLLQLALAFLVLALAVGRRLGRPVEEDLPVDLAGNELTIAVGGLLERSGQPASVARRLQAGLHRDLVRYLGLSADAAPAIVAEAAAARTAVSAEAVQYALTAPVNDAAAMTDVARRIVHLRDEIVMGRSVDTPSTNPLEEAPHG